MKSYKHYNRYEAQSKTPTAIAIVLALIAIIGWVLMLCGMFDEPLWKPDIEIPMVNTNVSWEQTNYPGGMAT